MKIFKKVLNILTTVLLVSLIILLVAMFIARASGNSLSVFGYRLYRVSSGSMEPTLSVGDVILVHKTSAEDIHKGDIVTYKAQEGIMAGNTITHRVVAEPEERGGTWYLQTKGDAAGATLDPEITASQLMGKYVRTLPLISKIYSFFLTPTGLIAMIALILVLFGYEMISMIVSYRSFDKLNDRINEEQTRAALSETADGDTAADDETAENGGDGSAADSDASAIEPDDDSQKSE